MMRPLFMGVDVAGADNTWVAVLAPGERGAEVLWGPHLATLQEIDSFVDQHNVVAVAIDAQLTSAISDDKGFRSGDRLLRKMLPAGCQDWVASINSLMAVPVRGQMLANTLSPNVGTIIETHPRASLHFALGAGVESDVKSYKRGPNVADAIARLWTGWAERFKVSAAAAPVTDGALDALVCASVALLYHRSPDQLARLRHTAHDRRGYGPFVVVAPQSRTPMGEVETAIGDASRGQTNVVSGASDTIVSEPRYDDVVGKSLLCPACGIHTFSRWPFGWDAHAAFTCEGLAETTPEGRKMMFRERYPFLFRASP